MRKLAVILGMHNKKICTVALVALAWLGVYGVSYLSSLSMEEYFSNSIVSVAAFVAVYVIMKLLVCINE